MRGRRGLLMRIGEKTIYDAEFFLLRVRKRMTHDAGKKVKKTPR